ncbi:MAG: cation:dicarboxylase symporter family transporter [Bdellovibrionaceae bacterium]|nr:cation:dicarboxylase symporter family transporter [Pseudobdellovibrionaceae bacterium]
MILTKIKSSISIQIIIGAICGVALGAFFPGGELQVFVQIAKMAIHWVKIIAGPYLFISVFLSLLQVQTQASVGLKLIGIALLNTTLAILIGISLTTVLVQNTTFEVQVPQALAAADAPPTLSLGSWVKTFMPDSLLMPLLKHEILLLALIALLLGIATRRAFSEDALTLQKISTGGEKIKKVMEQLLHWILALRPIAVFFIIAGSVSQYGFSLFSDLSKYVGVVILALTLQCLIVYGGWTLLIAKMNFSKLWSEIKTPFFYSIGVNSSLATLPLTLKALKNLGVSDRSASLGAGVATNLNNDGIVLYEASAVFFIAFLTQADWGTTQMVLAALTCIVASMGITGIPEAGFISLTVVVSAMGLPMEALPLLLSVDWILGRLRSGVNVLSDITLSVALDTVAPIKKSR